MAQMPEPPRTEQLKAAFNAVTDHYHALRERASEQYNEFVARHAAAHRVLEREIDSMSDARLRRVGFAQAIGASVVALLVLSMLPTSVSAQESQEAGDLMCESGIGDVLGLALGAFVVGLSLLSIFRLLLAGKDMGSPQPDKKKKGRDELTGGLITIGSVFLLPAVALGLERVGFTTLSCVDFTNIF